MKRLELILMLLFLRTMAKHIIDWSDESLTATQQDHIGAASHPVYGLPSSAQDLWQGSLLFAGTETANNDGGYLEGALTAAKTAADRIKS